MAVFASTVLDFASGDDDVLKIAVSPSPLEVGDNVRIDVFAPYAYELTGPYDGLDKLPVYGIAQQFEEDIDINDQSIVTTQYPVASVQSAYWLSGAVNTQTREIAATIGEALDVDIVNHRLSFDGSNLIGTLRLKYTTFLPQSWQHRQFNAPGNYALFYRKSGASEWSPLLISVDGGQPDDQSQPSIVTVQAKDFCTDLPVEGATVFVDGQSIGVTDINGKRVVGLMAAGAHSIKIQAPGFIPTDADDLQNDSFQV